MNCINRLSLLATIVLVPATANAHHGHVIVQQQVIQPVVVPFLYTTVSPYLVAEADNARIEKAVDRRLAQLGITGTLQQRAPTSIVSERCAVCHNGTDAVSFKDGFTASQYWTFSEMVGLGKYPAGGEKMKPVMEKLKAEGKAGDVTAYILQHRLADGVLQ